MSTLMLSLFIGKMSAIVYILLLLSLFCKSCRAEEPVTETAFGESENAGTNAAEWPDNTTPTWIAEGSVTTGALPDLSATTIKCQRDIEVSI